MSYVIKETSMKKGLPKNTTSLCPECMKIIDARIFQKDRKVLITKKCPEHGEFTDVYWSDIDLYNKAESWAFDGMGVNNPAVPVAKGCPFDCGLCKVHLSHTSLANLDLTNRCNLRCPICFANANEAGYVYEPSFEQVTRMLQTLRAERPVACTVVQFAGGEPTVYPRFFEVIEKARELGFAQIQVATNGIKMATEPGFTQRMLDSGMHTIYLQFDGLREENYLKARGKPLLDIKKKAVDSCKTTKPSKMSVVLVPTIVNGLNDDQVGEIVKYAIDNRDAVRAVNFQPVSFAGRIDSKERAQQRFTLPDLVDRLCKQTDFISKEDWYPVPVVTPISEFLSVIFGKPQLAFTPHPHCGLATYLYIDEDGKVTPLPRFINVEGLFRDLLEIAKKGGNAWFKSSLKVKAFKAIRKNFIKEKAPKGMSATKFISQLSTILSTTDKKATAEISWGLIMIGGMHFQDLYNYDIERVKRCVIHYVTPDCRIIPFCAYNTGPTYRTEIEKKFSVPLAEWKARNRGAEV